MSSRAGCALVLLLAAAVMAGCGQAEGGGDAAVPGEYVELPYGCQSAADCPPGVLCGDNHICQAPRSGCDQDCISCETNADQPERHCSALGACFEGPADGAVFDPGICVLDDPSLCAGGPPACTPGNCPLCVFSRWTCAFPRPGSGITCPAVR